MRRSTHSTLRRLVGTSVVVLATVVPAGVAAAADYPGGTPPDVNANSGSNAQASNANGMVVPYEWHMPDGSIRKPRQVVRPR